MRICGIEGCSRKHYAKGQCQAHYDRSRRGKPDDSPIAIRAPREWCAAVDCLRPPRARGLCWGHYMRLVRHTHATGPLKVVRVAADKAYRDAALLEDVAELVEWRINPVDAAKRVGYDNPATLAQKLKRLGRDDLARPFWKAA